MDIEAFHKEKKIYIAIFNNKWINLLCSACFQTFEAFVLPYDICAFKRNQAHLIGFEKNGLCTFIFSNFIL